MAAALRATRILRILANVGVALWCVGLGPAVGYSFSKPVTPDPSSGGTYALLRLGRGGTSVYLTKTEYYSLGAIWGTAAVLFVAGLRGSSRLARRSTTRPPSA
jgi:hypothetical protein